MAAISCRLRCAAFATWGPQPHQLDSSRGQFTAINPGAGRGLVELTAVLRASHRRQTSVNTRNGLIQHHHILKPVHVLSVKQTVMVLVGRLS